MPLAALCLCCCCWAAGDHRGLPSISAGITVCCCCLVAKWDSCCNRSASSCFLLRLPVIEASLCCCCRCCCCSAALTKTSGNEWTLSSSEVSSSPAAAAAFSAAAGAGDGAAAGATELMGARDAASARILGESVDEEERESMKRTAEGRAVLPELIVKTSWTSERQRAAAFVIRLYALSAIQTTIQGITVRNPVERRGRPRD